MSSSVKGEVARVVTAPVLLGTTRTYDHCVFEWREPEGGGPRVVEVRPEHCDRCIRELLSQGHKVIFVEPAVRR